MKLLLNKIYNMSCENGIKRLKQQNIKIDCIVTSPPYNVDKGYDYYKDTKPYDSYIKWLRDIFDDCRNILKKGSSVCINIGDQKNGSIPTHSHIIQFMLKLDYKLLTTIIWNKKHVSSRTSWGSWMSPSCPYFPTPFEYILVFRYKSLRHKGDKENIDIKKEDFIKNSLALWEIASEKKQKDHPARFPEELPKRLIQQLTYKNDIVMDIFSGSGTTCYVAKQLSRRYIGFEISKEYHELSKRILNEKI